MPSVDDVLRHAFDSPDEEWVRRAPSAHGELRARHRRQQLVRRSAAGSALAAAALVVGATVLDGDQRTRSVEPADPSPSSSVPAGATPLEGTWRSAPLDAADVRAAARRSGTPGAADAMLEELPDGPFRVMVVVRGSSLTTSVRDAEGEDLLLDQETVSTTGRLVELRPFDVAAATLHSWTLQDGELTMAFRSSTEPTVDGVPGEAWQRLLYDTAPFTR